jgi:hypothetical protein
VKIAHSSPVTPAPQPSPRFTAWLAWLSEELGLGYTLTLAHFGCTPETAEAASDAMDAEVARIRKAGQ